jgi:hypothetical protein
MTELAFDEFDVRHPKLQASRQTKSAAEPLQRLFTRASEVDVPPPEQAANASEAPSRSDREAKARIELPPKVRATESRECIECLEIRIDKGLGLPRCVRARGETARERGRAC